MQLQTPLFGASPEHLQDNLFTLVDELPYLYAQSGGGTAYGNLPLLRAYVPGLPAELDGLLITSDLQGIAPLPSDGGRTHLLGEALVERYEALAEVGEVPDPSRVLALIAGDMYSGPRARKRGATGDVTEVWLAFARSFGWVAGVAGNHDLFPNGTARRLLRRQRNAHLLDGETCVAGGLTIAGVSGIIGNKRKPNRHSPEHFASLLHRVLSHSPDVLVVHSGPPGGAPRQRGDDRVAAPVRKHGPPLVACGHCHWPEPLAAVGASTVLNVDSRAVLLLPLEPELDQGSDRRELESAPSGASE